MVCDSFSFLHIMAAFCLNLCSRPVTELCRTPWPGKQELGRQPYSSPPLMTRSQSHESLNGSRDSTVSHPQPVHPSVAQTSPSNDDYFDRYFDPDFASTRPEPHDHVSAKADGRMPSPSREPPQATHEAYLGHPMEVRIPTQDRHSGANQPDAVASAQSVPRPTWNIFPRAQYDRKGGGGLAASPYVEVSSYFEFDTQENWWDKWPDMMSFWKTS